MFRHKVQHRKQNKQLASLLSLVAGIVNVVGIVSIFQLTTNVTGHFGFFADELFKLNFEKSLVYFLYIAFFFLGSFFSNLLIELVWKKRKSLTFILPIVIESALLFFVAIMGEKLMENDPNVIAYLLLFSMGLQNALVTIISNAIVRTTHLTGLFTDLGIEVSQLFFYKEKQQRSRLIETINLRLRIVTYFFLGVILGGILYVYFDFYTLIFPSILLLVGIIFNSLVQKLETTTNNVRKRL